MELQKQYIEQAINLHNNNPVVDAHLDLAAELVYRVRNGEMNPLRTYYLKNLRAAGVNLVVSSVYQSDRQLLEEYEAYVSDHYRSFWRKDTKAPCGRSMCCRKRSGRIRSLWKCGPVRIWTWHLPQGGSVSFSIWKDWTASEQTLTGYISCGSWESGAHLSPGAGKMRWLTAAAKQESGYRSPVVLRPLEHVRSVRWNRWGCFWM